MGSHENELPSAVTLRRQVIFWAVTFVVLVLGLYVLRQILLPFIAGLALAYFLDPVADWLERLGLPRLAATFVILGLFLLVFVLALLLVLPILGDQVASFAQKLPGYVNTLVARANELTPPWLLEMIQQSGPKLSGSLSDVASRLAGWIGSLLGSIWSGGMALVNLVSLAVVTPIVAFYMLVDWDRMVAKVDSWLPRDHAETIRLLARQMNEAVAGFIRGQGTVCLSLGLFYAVSLTVAGLDFGLLIGILSGLLSFIPYIGSLVGGILSIGMALVQFWPDWIMVLTIAGIFAIGQFIEGNFLSPLLVGDRVGLHPVWLMFALFAFGYLFGFVGLLLAVPMAACVAVLVRYALKRYLSSPLYLGGSGPDPARAGGEAGQKSESDRTT